MHSEADLEAFTAALNKNIKGDSSTSQPSDSGRGIIYHLAFLCTMLY